MIGQPGGGISSVPINQTAAGTDELVAAPGVDKRIMVVNYTVVQGAAGTVKFTDGTADLSGAMSFAANGGATPSAVYPILVAGTNRPLNIVTTGAAGKGHLAYFLER